MSSVVGTVKNYYALVMFFIHQLLATKQVERCSFCEEPLIDDFDLPVGNMHSDCDYINRLTKRPFDGM